MFLARIRKTGILLGTAIILLVFVCRCDVRSDSNPGDSLLFDFELGHELDLFRWKCRTLFSLSDDYKAHGNKSLKMEFFPTRQVGFSTGQISHDWSNVEALEFTVFNPSTREMNIYLQIRDDSTKGDPANAYLKQLTIVPGENIVKIPSANLYDSKSRKLDSHHIRGFYIYMQKITLRRTLYFDYFRLI